MQESKETLMHLVWHMFCEFDRIQEHERTEMSTETLDNRYATEKRTSKQRNVRIRGDANTE